MERQIDLLQAKEPSSKRLYNWNTTHFYPDVHKLDNDELSVLHHRRHSEPRCFVRFTDNVSNGQQSSSSSSSLASVDEVKDKQDTSMPVSQLTVQFAAPNTPCSTSGGPIAKVDVDLDSDSESEDDAPKTWHRSPLHIRRGRCLGVGGRSVKKTDTSSVPADVAGQLWKQAADRPSIRLKEQAEKRRKFLQQRCQMYGWDLTSDQEKQSAEQERQQNVTSQPQEDLQFIDHSRENSSVNQDRIESSSASVAMKDYVCKFESIETLCALMKDSSQCSEESGRLVSGDTSPKGMFTNVSVKESSSFENIYDTVSLEPDKTPDDVEVVQLYESRQAVHCHTEPVTSSKLPQPDLQPSVRGRYEQDDRAKNLSSPASVANTAVNTFGINARRSSESGKSVPVQKPSLDAKSIVEEEKLKFVEYRIEYRRQHSSGNESGSGKSDGEKDLQRQPEQVSVSAPHITVPPDDYEYILRKIHYNRPQNKTEQRPSSSQSCSTSQGSELHIQIKRPQTTAHHITVDVAKPSVPHRVESLQHSGLHHQLLAKPDVIPSPNYPPRSNVIAGNFEVATDSGKDSNICSDRSSRTIYRSDQYHPTVSPGPSVLHTPGENSVYHWDHGMRTPDREHFRHYKPHHEVATSPNVQNVAPVRKPPKPRREEPPQNRSPDFWKYNTTYEPSSLSLQPQPSTLLMNNEAEMRHTSDNKQKNCGKHYDQDLVHDLVRGLEESSELTPEATAVFREQYRWSVHEPCHLVKPDQLKHSQPSQLPYSQVFASSVCVPSKPVQLVTQSQQDRDAVHGRRNRKETVFSVTGYHRHQQEKTNQLPQKDDWMRPNHSDVCNSYKNGSVMESEPLYWYSEADKRKPIINSPEVETALNRDYQQTYICDSGQQEDSRNLKWESSRNRSNEADSRLMGWKRDLCHRNTYTERDVHKNARLLGQKSQDRLVQQMSLGSQEVTGCIGSDSNQCRATSFLAPAYHNIHSHAQSHNIHTQKLRTESDQQKDVQSLTPGEMLFRQSHASTGYEKHVLQDQESDWSQVMAQIEPSTAAASCTVQENSLSAKNCQNVSGKGIFANYSVSESAGRVAGIEAGKKRHDVGNQSDEFIHYGAHSKQFGSAGMTNHEQCGLYEDEDLYPVSVAEIKAKLFGANEVGARKLFQRQTDAVPCSQRGRPTGGTLYDSVSYSPQQRKWPFTSDELKDFEKLVERLESGETPVEKSSEWCSISQSVPAAQCSSTDDPTVKRLSVTNIKLLEDSKCKQSSSLEYAKEWLINGRHASASVVSDKLSEHMPASYVAEGNAVKSTVHNVPPAPVPPVHSFISHKSTKSLPCTKSGDMCRPVASSYVSISSIDEVTKSRLRTQSSAEGSVVLRSSPVGHSSSVRNSSSSSFVRRSLPALSEKDAERWQNMVLRVRENESKKVAKSYSIERLSHSHCDLGIHPHLASIPSDSAECKLTVSAQPLLYVTPDDLASLKPKRQHTPRDVKCRDESRIKGFHAPIASTDSGYLGSGSDSRASSGAEVPQRLPSESNESDELELQRYTCDESDDAKVSSGSVANVDSAFTLADKTDTSKVSMSEHRVCTELSKSGTKQLQKLRGDRFSKNGHQSHSSSVSDRCDNLTSAANKDVAFDHSESSKFARSVSFSLGLPKSSPAKPLYVSPLGQTSSYDMYRMPVITSHACDRSCTTVNSSQLLSPLKISSFKMIFPSQQSGQNTESGYKSSETSQSSEVTHIPVRAAAVNSGQSPVHSSAFIPYAEHKDLQISRTGVGEGHITEQKKEVVHMETEQHKENKHLERTKPSFLNAYQCASTHFTHERQEMKEPCVRITTGQVTDSKIERTYRIESHCQPKALQLTAGNELDKCEMSDGEMTDATDVTLDVMVGANQPLTPTVDTVDFSDVEFLSLANLPARYNISFTRSSAMPHMSHPFNTNSADAHVRPPDDGSGDAAVAAAKTESELYKKNKKDVKTGEGEPPVERRRSIKELVHSFEGMTSPFMRVRPRSMEIRLSSPEEEHQDDSVTGRKHKNITLRASSSFKEASRMDRKNRQQAKEFCSYAD